MDDEKIIDLYFARDETALTATSEKYGAYLRGISQNILHSASDAEECENDAYLAAWNRIPPLRPKCMAAFLGRLTRNISLDRLDYNKAQKREAVFAAQEELDAVASCLPSPEDELAKKQLAEHISAFLHSIQPLKRQIFVRRYWYGDSIGTIASLYNISESKVTSMLFRMRAKLRTYLEKEGVSP